MPLDEKHHKKLNRQLRDLLAMIRTGSQPPCIRERTCKLIEEYAPQDGGDPGALEKKWLIRRGWQEYWDEHGTVATAWVSFTDLPQMDGDHARMRKALADALHEMVRMVMEDVGLEYLKEKLAKYLRTQGLKDGEVVEVPRWDGTTLWLGEKVVKRYRGGDAARNCKDVLEDFHRRGWPPEVPSPFGKDPYGQKRMADTIRRLNDGQDHIRFFPKTGKAIGWELRP